MSAVVNTRTKKRRVSFHQTAPRADVDAHETSRVPDAANKHRAPLPPPIPAWKRRLDVFCIVTGLPLILPLMALIAFWIRLVSGGPALLRQTRIGRNGRPFVLYKFRCMKRHSDTGRHEAYVRNLVNSNRPMIKLDLLCDSQLIAGGCLLRAAGLDELPQLLNVLRREMSLVGPRPCLPGEHAFFSPKQRERFNALPGLTGIWQVSGKDHATFREMNVMDIHYVRNASVMMDLQIMLRTPAALLVQMVVAFQHKNTASQDLPFRQTVCESDQGYALQRQNELQ